MAMIIGIIMLVLTISFIFFVKAGYDLCGVFVGWLGIAWIAIMCYLLIG